MAHIKQNFGALCSIKHVLTDTTKTPPNLKSLCLIVLYDILSIQVKNSEGLPIRLYLAKRKPIQPNKTKFHMVCMNPTNPNKSINIGTQNVYENLKHYGMYAELVSSIYYEFLYVPKLDGFRTH